MSIRIPLQPCLRLQGSAHPRCIRSFSTSGSQCASSETQKRYKHDPYARAQALAKKTANKSRQETLRKERVGALGDPIRGVTTPFVQSFDTAQAYITNPKTTPVTLQERTDHVNFLLAESQVNPAIEWNHRMYGRRQSEDENPIPSTEQKNAEEALRRIMALKIGSSQDRQRVNTQRAIDTFGRHNYDQSVPSEIARVNRVLDLEKELKSLQAELPILQEEVTQRKAFLQQQRDDPEAEKADIERAQLALFEVRTREREHHKSVEKVQQHIRESQLKQSEQKRGGPDTGSSEVQIAILTSKIRTLADFLEGRGKNDKANKRNLRLLVHRRQKLMRYMQRKERGGRRWQHVVEQLGLTDGMWKGEISL